MMFHANLVRCGVPVLVALLLPIDDRPAATASADAAAIQGQRLMKRGRVQWTGVVLLPSLLGLVPSRDRGQGQGQGQVETDLAGLKGRWNLTTYKNDGETMLRAARGFRYYFDAEVYAFSRNYGIVEEGEFSIDPSQRPKQIDFQLESNGRKLTRQGIYELDGDTLKLCFSSRRHDIRPKVMSDQRGSHQFIYPLDRVHD
jgi:uncharacterized protein (TIGR03067 family)